MSKRIFDLLLCIISLVITLPFYLFIYLGIKIDDKGKIFYTQSRVGLNGKEFSIIKFRTMKTHQEFASSITIKDDPRITRFGKLLRRYKIDEWPTIFNVIKSEMSFVGPRPESPNYVKFYNKQQLEVLKVKPGITDPATILFNEEADLLVNVTDSESVYRKDIMPRKLKINLDYIQNQTLLTDVKIILDTILLITSK